jgi:hypothetical protein
MSIEEKAKELAALLIKSEKENGGDYLFELVKEFRYGTRVKSYLYTLTELISFCIKNNHLDSDTARILGDDDAKVWFETAKDRQILIIRRLSSCSDSNFVFIIERAKLIDSGSNELNNMLIKLNGRSKVIAKIIGDDDTLRYDDDDLSDKSLSYRSYDKISLDTLRNNDFNFGYNDFRDTGHAFKYLDRDDEEAVVSDAHLAEINIDRAFQQLVMTHTEVFEL